MAVSQEELSPVFSSVDQCQYVLDCKQVSVGQIRYLNKEISNATL